MHKEAGEIFYSKIMLFGEYTIIKGSMGLTIPYAHFNGQLAFPNKDSYTDLAFAQRSNQHLYDFWYYLQALANSNSLLCNFNTEQLKEDLDNGLYFESTIPEGYGLGSSGALVAAFFQKYVTYNFTDRENMSPSEIRALKEQLSQLESWFHGTSSGIDPLICYFKHPLLLKDLDHIEPVGLPRYNKKKSDAIFLINSGKPGKTAPLVQQFINNYDGDDVFRNFVNHQLTSLNNACINNLINNHKTEFYECLKELSIQQKKHLSPMVPTSIHSLWDEGIASQEYFLKLCGSGGGGFILGFTRDYESTRKFMDKNGLETIPVYQDLRKTIKT